MNDFYVYGHRRADNNELFYVGKGRGRRANIKHGRSEYWTRIANKHGFVVEFLATGLTEDESFKVEKELIARHEGLCNLTDGGEGISGYKHSPEVREIISKRHKGRKQSLDEIENRAKALRGKKRTPEQCMKNGSNMRGKKHTNETKEKMSAAHAGQFRSPEAIEKVAAAHRGMKRTDDSRQRMSDASSVKRAIRCIDNGLMHDSLEAAAAWMARNGYPKANRTGIWFSASGRRERSYGLRWEYA